MISYTNTAIQTKWIETLTEYSKTQFTWGDVITAQEIVYGGKSSGDFGEWLRDWQKDDTKRKRVIKLLCKINGKQFSEEKTYRTAKINVKDAKLIVKSVLGVELNILNENLTVGDIHV